MNPDTTKAERAADTRMMDALARLGLYALNDKSPDDVVHRGIQICCEILQLDYCLLHEFNREENKFQMRQAFGSGFEGDCPDKAEVGDEIEWDAGFAYETKELVTVDDYINEKRFGLPPLLQNYNIRSGVNVIVEGTEETYGVLGAYSKSPCFFSEYEENFLRVIANMIGETIDRNRAYQKLEKSNKQLKKEIRKSKEYQREILSTNILERWELGSYLHDNISQMLAFAKMTVDNIDKGMIKKSSDVCGEIEALKQIIDDSISGIRNLTQDIIPIDIEKDGVVHAFRLLVRRAQKLYGVTCSFEIDDTIDSISKIKHIELATNLYHIIQEAIKNAALHGKADHIRVSFTRPNGDLVLKVEDDGVGLSNTSNDKQGKGLRIMEHRMDLLGGSFYINGVSDVKKTGTCVTCTLPMKYLTKLEKKGK